MSTVKQVIRIYCRVFQNFRDTSSTHTFILRELCFEIDDGNSGNKYIIITIYYVVYQEQKTAYNILKFQSLTFWSFTYTYFFNSYLNFYVLIPLILMKSFCIFKKKSHWDYKSCDLRKVKKFFGNSFCETYNHKKLTPSLKM